MSMLIDHESAVSSHTGTFQAQAARIADQLSSLFHAYGMPEPVPILTLNEVAAAELDYRSTQLPSIDWTNPNIKPEILNSIQSTAFDSSSVLLETLSAARQNYHKHGVSVLSFGERFAHLDPQGIKKDLLFVLAHFGVPFGAFHQKGFWQTLGVNKDALALRAESMGYIPLHIDFDQASHPPDGVALFCVRPDPRGGGESTIFEYQRFLSLLSDQQRQELGNIYFSYSTLYQQNGIGDVYNPHPLLESRQGKPFFRYNGKVLPEVGGDFAPLFSAMEEQFRKASSSYLLKAGDLLIVDQTRTLHGRLPLAEREHDQVYDTPQDRLLLQTYLRHPF